MNTQKIQTSELETVLQNVHPNRRKVLAAMLLAASAGLPCVAPASASASTLASSAAHMTANDLASFEGAQLLTWIVNEISLLTARARPDSYSKIKVSI
jgi:hypothetical protein